MSERHSQPFGDELYQFDRAIEKEQAPLTGIDEAGRGPLAGPVIAAAVCLDLSRPIEGLNDSKKLTASVRERLYEKIVAQATGWAVGSASPEEIDRYNILQATLMAMHRAVEQISCPWNVALVDGNKTIPFIAAKKQRAIVDGDALSASVAAASIIAKVTRDRIMQAYHEQYPIYEFNNNKGYATEFHRNRIMEHGLCQIHRRSFCENLAVQTRLPL